MKRTSRAIGWLVLLCFLAAAAFSVDRFLAMRTAEAQCNSAIQDLSRAGDLLKRHPGPFTESKGGDGATRMKKLIQERSAKNGIRLGYLSESGGDAGRGFREKALTMRFGNVKHASLVTFLAEIERMGEGATFKEIKLRPSDKLDGCYASAECVVSWRFFDEKANGKMGRKVR